MDGGRLVRNLEIVSVRVWLPWLRIVTYDSTVRVKSAQIEKGRQN